MTVRVYRHTDASAPLLTGNAADYKLIDVLDKCLVAGYGSKSAAGWTKEFTGTGKAVFKQGTGSNGMRLRVDCSTSSQTPRLRAYESMTEVDTGTNPFPTDAQISGGGYAYTSSTADTTQRPWMVVATEKAFYLYIGHGDTTAQGVEGSTAYKNIYFFGDYTSFVTGDAYNTLLVCNTTSSAFGGNFAGVIGTYATANIGGKFAARQISQAAGSYAADFMVDVRGSGSTIGAGSGNGYPDAATGDMLLGSILIVEKSTNSAHGVLPGAWAPLHNLPGSPGDTFSGNGQLNGKTFILWDAANTSTRCRVAIETSNTW